MVLLTLMVSASWQSGDSGRLVQHRRGTAGCRSKSERYWSSSNVHRNHYSGRSCKTANDGYECAGRTMVPVAFARRDLICRRYQSVPEEQAIDDLNKRAARAASSYVPLSSSVYCWARLYDMGTLSECAYARVTPHRPRSRGEQRNLIPPEPYHVLSHELPRKHTTYLCALAQPPL